MDGVAVGVVGRFRGGHDLEDGASVFRLEMPTKGRRPQRPLRRRRLSARRQRRWPRGRLLCTGGADGVVKCYTMRGGADGEPCNHRRPMAAPSKLEDVPIHFAEASGAHALRGHAGRRRRRGAGGRQIGVSASIDGSISGAGILRRTGAQLFALTALGGTSCPCTSKRPS